QRMVTLRIPIVDQPGVLARVSQIVGEQGGNIIDVLHRRLSLNLSAKSATLELSFEARDAPHAQAIVAAIRAAYERIRGWIRRTPLLTSERIDKDSGASLYFKCEGLQEIGAFKARGAS